VQTPHHDGGDSRAEFKSADIPNFLLLYLLAMDSPYINEVDVVPPSPQLDSYHDLPPFNDPSYYSPFSNHSELSFIGEHDLDLAVFDDPARSLLTDYDPADYDNPTASSLLVYQDNDYMAPYNYASPSSDNDDDRPSRASSVSYSASPRFDVAQSFEAMSFRSPAFPNESLPHSPQPLSPPRFFMPDDHLPDPQPLPKINAPDPDNGLGGGLMLNIVPATPIGSGASAANPAPFLHSNQQSPFQLAQNQPDSSLGLQLQQPWSTVNHPASTQSSNILPKQEYTFPSQSSLFDDYPSSAPSNSRSGDDAAVPASNSFLIPARTRSKSETSPEQLPWAQPYLSSAGVSDQTVNDIPSQQSQLNPNFTFGGKPANNFLSPNNPSSIRRVKSETVSKPIHRQSRSEDIRGIGLPPSHSGHHHSQSSSSQFLSPADQRGYLSPSLPTFGTLPSGGRSTSPVHPPDASSRHIRRASSGTRSERGSEAWPGGSPLAQHRVSPYPSPHASPRLRINDLPYDDFAIRSSLLDVGFPQSQASYHNGYPGTYTPSSTGGSTYHTPGQSPSPTPQLTIESPVPRPTVTTGRTADASLKRRKQDATFSCPVPGCGSTFTRSFNLKGDRYLFSFNG